MYNDASQGYKSDGKTGDIKHRCDDLITIFNQLFSSSFNTHLIRGDHEPVYLPAHGQIPYHQVVFAHGFFSSALHEIAHWCIAGEKRRHLVDYGYWYAADGRTAQQQSEFEVVEIKPQALEWIFSSACEKKFRVSIDNLNGEDSDPTPFKEAVHQQVVHYCSSGLSGRAALFYEGLVSHFKKNHSLLTASSFLLSEC